MIGTAPLERHLAFESTDRDEARERVARVFCPHHLELLRPGAKLRVRQHLAQIGSLALSYISYGAEVSIDPAELTSFFLVHLVQNGSCEARIGGSAFVGDAHAGLVSSATLALRMKWSADCAHLVLKIDRFAFERHLSDLLGETATRPIEFAPMLAVESGAGASYRRLMEFVAAELDHDNSVLASPLGLVRVQQTLMTALLIGQPNNYNAALTTKASPAAPHHVVKAEAYIRACPDLPITIGKLAEIAGVSGRTLFEGFRRFRNTTPMALLAEVRLERANAELMSSSATNVTDVALRWGFVHLGRFAQIYRRRYGELPSETFRRQRGPSVLGSRQ